MDEMAQLLRGAAENSASSRSMLRSPAGVEVIPHVFTCAWRRSVASSRVGEVQDGGLVAVVLL